MSDPNYNTATIQAIILQVESESAVPMLLILRFEVHFIWERKLNIVTILFLLNRWLIFIWAFANLALVPNLYTLSLHGNEPTRHHSTHPSLHGLGRFYVDPVCDVVQKLLQNAFTSLKDLETERDARSTIIICVCSITSDVIVIAVTWLKTYNISRAAIRSNIRSPLSTLLLRDGTIWFLVLLCFNVLQIVGWTTNSFVYAADFLIMPSTTDAETLKSAGAGMAAVAMIVASLPRKPPTYQTPSQCRAHDHQGRENLRHPLSRHLLLEASMSGVESDAFSALLNAKGCDSRQQARKGSKKAPSQINIFLMPGRNTMHVFEVM
ncbi:hypothetical protein OBBRIDRAFT_806256 [Obba rivulosa]|uniref:Uncharacterized protein n=1 Tax=Obba rivulosa TaxID=1052685 RepID=A0A8E2AM35_9APHY|nr:hypothetical protein OBBRIDRAFT_806256 [Obba rivulosa]